jgi:hypothetical protein
VVLLSWGVFPDSRSGLSYNRSQFLCWGTYVRWCNQKFPDWPPGVRTASHTVLCHWVQLYHYFVSQSSEFCRHNHLCCFSTSVYFCKHIFPYRLSPETFGYTLVLFHFYKVSSRFNFSVTVLFFFFFFISLGLQSRFCTADGAEVYILCKGTTAV